MGAFGLGMILAVQQSTPSFRDVPAGHWAKEAVDFITQCGLIQGFEDGTFRGNQNLTRYQAALIFYRFIQLGGRCPNQPTTPQDQAMIDKAMEEVSKELSDLKAQIAGITEANTAQDAKLQALETQLQQLAAAQAQPAPAPTVDTSALEARIAALEEELKKVAAAQAQPAPAPTVDTSALEARIAALEEELKKVAAAQAQPAPTPAPAPTTAEQESSQQARLEALESLAKELNNQIKALNDQVNTLKGEVDTLKAAAVQPVPPPQPVPAPQPAQPEATPPAPAPAPLPRMYFGLGASYPVEPMVSGPIEQVISVGGFIGVHDVILGFGPRVGADYNLGNGAINVNAYLVRNFNRGGFFDPYLGLGVRYDASSTNPNIVPVYGDALLGAGFNFSRNFGLYLEGNPGLGDNLSLRFGVRAGLKLSF